MDSVGFALRGTARRVGAAHPGVKLHCPSGPARSSTGKSPEWLAAQVRSCGADLGFAAVGFTSAQALVDRRTLLGGWLGQGYHGSMSYLSAPPDRADPLTLLPEAKSIVAVALPHRPLPRSGDPSFGRAGPWARYTQGADYHFAVRSRLLRLADQICELVEHPVLARACVDTAPLLEREVAMRAGLGFIGKSSLLIVPKVGSTVLLGELLVDVELAPDAPSRPRCGRCQRCLDACPTGAFVGPYLIDARRCISYLTIEHRGSVPHELRPLMGTWVFGCDECQRACPYNWGKAAQSRSSQLGEVPGAPERPSLADLLHLSSSGYRRLVRGTALSRVSREQFARNAAIALGNSGAREAAEPLRLALKKHSSPLVRGHAAWALGRLKDPSVIGDLQACAVHDPVPVVRQEAQVALANMPTECRL